MMPSRFFTTEHTEHTETNSHTVLSCFRVFGVFRGSLLFSDQSEQHGDGVEKCQPTQ